MWATHTLCRNAADKVITATHLAFRDRSECAGQLDKVGGNADLVEYLSKEVVSNSMLRERLLKGIADDLPMKKTFEDWSDFLRGEATDMDNKGKVNEDADCVTQAPPPFRYASVPPMSRGRGGPSRGRGTEKPQRRGEHRGG